MDNPGTYTISTEIFLVKEILTVLTAERSIQHKVFPVLLATCRSQRTIICTGRSEFKYWTGQRIEAISNGIFQRLKASIPGLM